MELLSKELFAESPGAGVAAGGSCWYVARDGVEMEAVFATQTRSDTSDRRWRRLSSDNGRTWGDPEEIEFIRRDSEGTHRVYIHPGQVDPFTGRLIRLSNRVCLPTDEPSEGASRWAIWYEVSLDGGGSYGEAKPVTGNGNMLGDQTCVPIFLPDGEILAPFQLAEFNEDGTLFQPYDTPFYQSRVAIGRWRDESSIDWQLSDCVRLSPQDTTRGAFEPTIALVPDGRILMVLRGSNMRRTELPGYRWHAISSDSGRTWGEVSPWTYDDGSHFFSPSSCSLLIGHSSGRLLWIGNIARENPDGNLPRYPMVIGEVDEKSLLLKKDTMIAIDDVQPGESPRTCLSNFYAYDDRETGEIVMCMPRWFTKSTEKLDWTTNSYIYRIGV
jgi:hypothetical protein